MEQDSRVMAEISVIPLGTGTPSVGEQVAAALRTLEAFPAVEHELTAMGTTLVGERGAVLAACEAMHAAVLAAGAGAATRSSSSTSGPTRRWTRARRWPRCSAGWQRNLRHEKWAMRSEETAVSGCVRCVETGHASCIGVGEGLAWQRRNGDGMPGLAAASM